MSSKYRKTTPRVIDGRVQPKQRRTQPIYADSPRVAIERCRPGNGYRHVLQCRDVFNFINLIPGWSELSYGLATIQLCESRSCLGWFRPRIVAVCPMPRELQIVFDREFFYRDKDFFDELNVGWFELEHEDEDLGRIGQFVVSFTAESARCFQLLRVLLHELGHHHDWMTSRRNRCTRGEDYAETYSRQMEKLIWNRYIQMFGDPR